MEVGKANTLDLLSQAGLPQFELGPDGYPLPGKVVKYYREQMKYSDKESKEKHWTQAELAKRLGVTEIMVNIMENQNKGLDSIERRRTLAAILRIPPALLGLGSLDIIVEISAGQATTAHKPSSTNRTRIGADTIKLYKDTLGIYKKTYSEGLSYMSVRDLEKWTKRIENDMKNMYVDDKKALLQVLWGYEILCAKVYSSDLHDWNKTFKHIDNAREIAMTLDDRDLQAASLCHSAIFHFRQKRLGLAKMDIDGALMYAKGALPQTRGIILSKSACIRSDDAGLLGTTLVQNILDEAEKYTDAKSEIRNISYGKDDYLLDRAYTFIAFERAAKALEFIDDAERYINSNDRRHLVFLDILRAECYIEQKKPEYKEAVRLLEGAVGDSKKLRVARNISHIEKLYGKLLESSYSKAPDVIDLGIALQELRVKIAE